MKLTLPDSVASHQDLAGVLNDVHSYAKWASRELIKQKSGWYIRRQSTERIAGSSRCYTGVEWRQSADTGQYRRPCKGTRRLQAFGANGNDHSCSCAFGRRKNQAGWLVPQKH